jgi:hypothetical protein
MIFFFKNGGVMRRVPGSIIHGTTYNNEWFFV